MATLDRFAPRALASAFLRSLAIQACWNYRTMIGNGFAHALIPFLRAIHGDDRQALDDAVRRHMGHFNSNPYLVGVALGAVARQEAEGASPASIDRFKVALRGPLGSLGDHLVWASWVPFTALIAVLMALGRVPAAGVALGFLALYNVGHLALRIWAFRVGLRAGPAVGRELAAAGLTRWANWLSRLSALVMGILFTLALADGWDLMGREVILWSGGALGAFVLGTRLRQQAWRPVLAGLWMVIGVLFVVGWIQ